MLALLSLPFFFTFDVVLVGASVAFHTVVKLANALFNVFAPDIGWRVFMAAITGVPLVVVAHMASGASGCVIAVKHKVLGVIESGWGPLLLGMTLRTVARNLLVQRIAR